MDEPPSDPIRASRRLFIAWGPVIAWAALIFAFSAQPNLTFLPDEGLDFVLRKAGHMVVFGVLALVAWRAIASTTHWRPPWAWAITFTLLYAVTDELHQGFVEGRQASVMDLAIDTTGAVIAVAAVLFVSRRSRVLSRRV